MRRTLVVAEKYLYPRSDKTALEVGDELFQEVYEAHPHYINKNWVVSVREKKDGTGWVRIKITEDQWLTPRMALFGALVFGGTVWGIVIFWVHWLLFS